LFSILRWTAGLVAWLCTAALAPDAAWAGATPKPGQMMNSPPLPAGAAATVRTAQGTETNGVLLGAAVTGSIFLALLLLVDGDDSGPVTAPVTSQ
jgi:hypothetical protein